MDMSIDLLFEVTLLAVCTTSYGLCEPLAPRDKIRYRVNCTNRNYRFCAKTRYKIAVISLGDLLKMRDYRLSFQT